MTGVQPAAAVRGKTIRFNWTDGPTKGTTHEHVFHPDGTVEWHEPHPTPKAGAAKDRPTYGARKVADDIYVVSYLAGSGYTLTVVLNFRDNRIVGFASGAKEWYPVQGTFEIVK
jgi:hypothetical protein